MKQLVDEIVEKVLNTVSSTNDRYVHFSQDTYKPRAFDQKYFSLIKNVEGTDRSIAFIDGGSAELLKSAHFSLHFIRLYFCVYKDKKRIQQGTKDFYAFLSTQNREGELFYSTDFFGYDLLEKDDFVLSSTDETIKTGLSRASISSLGSVIRRCAELFFAKSILAGLGSGDIVVLDGTLQCTFTNEKKYMDSLLEKGYEKGISICGLSKTSNLMTDQGNAVVSKLQSYGVSGSWFYYPVVDISDEHHRAEIAFAKFHSYSDYVFRFEIFNQQKDRLNDAMEALSLLSTDSVFLGYPYGLIDADRNARISNAEKSMLLTYFKTRFGKHWNMIDSSLKSLDAHAVLDSIG